MKILFLQGWHSVPGGVKPSYLIEHGHEVINLALDDDDFDRSVRTAQAEYDRHRPEVIVGSSRGGAIAMNLISASTPLVLLCPAWRRWGTARTVKPGTVISHSEADGLIPFADSRDLCEPAACPIRPRSSWARTIGSPIPSRSRRCWRRVMSRKSDAGRSDVAGAILIEGHDENGTGRIKRRGEGPDRGRTGHFPIQ